MTPAAVVTVLSTTRKPLNVPAVLGVKAAPLAAPTVTVLAFTTSVARPSTRSALPDSCTWSSTWRALMV
nr:hypothetical protein [Pengzhenrongella sicca]